MSVSTFVTHRIAGARLARTVWFAGKYRGSSVAETAKFQAV
jgi:hypothetical protein